MSAGTPSGVTTLRRIKPGYGYWDTTKYPIGGCFARAPADGLLVTVTGPPIYPRVHGCNERGRTEDGRTVAYSTDTTEFVGDKPESHLPPSGDSDDGRYGRYEE